MHRARFRWLLCGFERRTSASWSTFDKRAKLPTMIAAVGYAKQAV